MKLYWSGFVCSSNTTSPDSIILMLVVLELPLLWCQSSHGVWFVKSCTVAVEGGAVAGRVRYQLSGTDGGSQVCPRPLQSLGYAVGLLHLQPTSCTWTKHDTQSTQQCASAHIYFIFCAFIPTTQPVDISTHTGYSICNSVHASILILASAPLI